MDSSASVTRVLLSLKDFEYRVGWLKERLGTWTSREAAMTLNGICEAAERGEPASREALLTVATIVVQWHGDRLLEELHALATKHALWSLERLLRRTPEAPRDATEPPPVPDYRAGRALTLGERRSLARKPDRRAFDRLLRDPHPLVIRQLLENPRLTEDDVVRLAAHRPAHLVALEELAQRARWLAQARVRRAMLHNPGCPLSLTVPLLGLCTRSELDDLVENPEVPGILRATASELLERRPPLEHASTSPLLQ